MTSKLREWLEEETRVSPEQLNWRKIQPKMEQVIRNLAEVSKMVTRDTRHHEHLLKIINSLKAINADVRGMASTR